MTTDGERLHGEIDVAEDPAAAAVVLHPHPMYGGDRHNSVVQAVRRRLVADGCTVATFDFRGVGESTGHHGDGVAERLDALAAVEHVHRLHPAARLVLVGYSFGALVALSTLDPAVGSWVAIAPPLGDGPAPAASGDLRPKLVLSGTHDQFCPADAARRRVAEWTTAAVVEVPQADHFLGGRLDVAADEVARFVTQPA